MPEEIVTATEANRDFSRLLHRVEAGSRFIVTYHGKPVARIEPIGPDEAMAATRERARLAHLDRLAQQPTVTIGPWTRDELYEDEE